MRNICLIIDMEEVQIMLIEFSVKNFLSFKNLVTLSMEKGNGD
jgi:hypothetical protein